MQKRVILARIICTNIHCIEIGPHLFCIIKVLKSTSCTYKNDQCLLNILQVLPQFIKEDISDYQYFIKCAKICFSTSTKVLSPISCKNGMAKETLGKVSKLIFSSELKMK